MSADKSVVNCWLRRLSKVLQTKFCLFDLIIYVPSTLSVIKGSSWVELVLS